MINNSVQNLQIRTPVWDLPVRLFHWALVILIGMAWWTAEQRLLDWHRYCGYALLTLLLFRLAWGVFGSTTARFSFFLCGPARAISYCRNELFTRSKSPHTGHNPLGGWSVVALLGLLLLQTLLGLFAVDIDGIESGPLSYLVSFDNGRLASQMHHLVFNILLGFIGLHFVAIVFYRVHKKENLLSAMIIGSKSNGEPEKIALYFAPVWLAAGLLAISAIAVFVLTQVLGR